MELNIKLFNYVELNIKMFKYVQLNIKLQSLLELCLIFLNFQMIKKMIMSH